MLCLKFKVYFTILMNIHFGSYSICLTLKCEYLSYALKQGFVISIVVVYF